MARKKLTNEQFIQRAITTHGGLYDYSAVNYLGIDTSVIIHCKVHGGFSQRPQKHLEGKGCPLCAVDKRKQTRLDKYGVEFIFQSPNMQAKVNTTNQLKYGGIRPIQNQTILEQIKQTNIKRYGVDNPFKNNSIREQIKQTNINKYGVGTPLACDIIKHKIEQTNIERYGTKSPLSNQQIREQIKHTNLERYGVNNPLSNQQIREQIKRTNFKRYGVEHIGQSHMVDILSLVEDSTWLYDQYITQNKTAAQIAIELEVNGTTIGNYLRKHEIEIKQRFWTSYKCQMWLEQQGVELWQEWNIPGTRYRADGYCKLTNTIYEFHGDYWHGNPYVFLSTEINEVVGKSMGDLYKQTIIREDLIKALGYNLIVMWESDFII